MLCTILKQTFDFVERRTSECHSLTLKVASKTINFHRELQEVNWREFYTNGTPSRNVVDQLRTRSRVCIRRTCCISRCRDNEQICRMVWPRRVQGLKICEGLRRIVLTRCKWHSSANSGGCKLRKYFSKHRYQLHFITIKLYLFPFFFVVFAV